MFHPSWRRLDSVAELITAYDLPDDHDLRQKYERALELLV
jgi:hypothetical protein